MIILIYIFFYFVNIYVVSIKAQVFFLCLLYSRYLNKQSKIALICVDVNTASFGRPWVTVRISWHKQYPSCIIHNSFPQCNNWQWEVNLSSPILQWGSQSLFMRLVTLMRLPITSHIVAVFAGASHCSVTCIYFITRVLTAITKFSWDPV